MKNFRNYSETEIEFDEKLNILLGQNGQGKTNILEALYLNAFGKSFRTSKDKDMVKFGENGFYVRSLSKLKDLDEKIEILFKDGEKTIKINNNGIKRLSELLSYIHIVVFSPEDLKIVKDDPQKRRNFLDITLCKTRPVYLSFISNYKKALLHKNILLKENNPSMDMVDIWNLELAKYGSRVIRERWNFIKKLRVISSKIHNDISNGKENLDIFYENNILEKSIIKEIESDLELQFIEQKFLEKLEENKKNEIFRKTSLLGPHRDDIIIKVNGENARTYGSQGQQKTAALSLKLSEIEIMSEEISEDCILILDDVLSELDESRQKYLIKSFKGIQTFISATELSSEMESYLSYGKKIYIKNGEVEKIV